MVCLGEIKFEIGRLTLPNDEPVPLLQRYL